MAKKIENDADVSEHTAYMREYRKTPKNRAYMKDYLHEYNQRPEAKAAKAERDARPENKAYMKEYLQGYKMEYSLMKRYGMTLDEYAEMDEEQGWMCKICKSPTSGRKDSPLFHVDHDHATGKVRGLLCNNCNVGIARLKEDATVLRSAIAYLA